MKIYEEILKEGTDCLTDAGIEEAALDAWYLFSYCTKMNRVTYLLNCKKEAEEVHYKEFQKCVRKRAERIPLQYIIGTQEFMGLVFQVNEQVLIPRQDTEVLVEEVLKHCRGKHVLDMCTGSGCIIISLKKMGDIGNAVGVDISPGALETAKKNAEQNQVSVTFIISDLFQAVDEKFDLIVANPPYIETDVISTLMPEVKEHEPLLALDGKEDGLYYYRRIAKEAPGYLKQGGMIFFEIGYNQGRAVKNILEESGFERVSVIGDLASLDRVVFGFLR
ncbi:peptide chain release factor N(5)-glutamine methyltransferase [Anaeromicropila populeti]|uniref:Release factor glutamine methyltransferase n=1 Tax=Anaeromicropila populeti TaxID=37658 RepID=A0A1I6JZM6_9FIRM|nr:peptide chain release factor N(5)-glutamine methyltransferase [Anaeromicropila populeti]SFR84413.1 release factor glutamine methyltransferase [Anaeromicropila populeti]